MNPKPATTQDIADAMVLYAEAMAEAIGLISHAIAKHLPKPDDLIDDLIAVSEPDSENNSPPIAIFFRRFNAVMKGGIEPTEH